jgi:phosphatidylserine/phosphatidylglycerophosphate/cardiolipin synthase-like enzyme
MRWTAVREASSASAIIEPGRNVWNVAKAEKAAFLIDGSAYFSALDTALRAARRTIWIVGWDFNPDICLRPRVSSETLGELLLHLVDSSADDLQVRILVWGMGPVYSGKSLKIFRESALSSHAQIHLRFDLRHPFRGCHHQKLVAIDDDLAFLGGIDLTARRWDEPDHRVDNALRTAPDGRPYNPVHDIQAMVSGDAARLIGDVARRRWRRATGETIATPPEATPSWPESIVADMRGSNAGIALTEPGLVGKRGRHEAIRLTRDAIRAAKKSIYIETQYLASFGIARRLGRRLEEPNGPEIVVLVTKNSHGLIEKLTMGGNRDRVIRRLKRMDHHDRLRILYPVVPNPKGGEQEVTIHSKVVIIDDRFVRIGSSNLNYRSEGLDTECDLALEAGEATHRDAISALRSKLLAEHLDTTVEAVDGMLLETRSLVKSLDGLNTSPRGLREFSVDLTQGGISPLPGTSVVDPQIPFHPLRRLRSLFATLRMRLAAIL